jgi:hypothetical protein
MARLSKRTCGHCSTALRPLRRFHASHHLWPHGFRFFALPVKGTLQLSLTRLLRYRSQDVFRVRGWCPRSSRAISNARYSEDPPSPSNLPLQDYHPLWCPVPGDFRFVGLGGRGFATPHFHKITPADSDCPVPSSIAFTEGISLISFLLATKMLQSARFPYPKGMLPRGEQDVQFSHSRIIDSLRLPATFRSLARPSSALEPSHPPCGVTAVFFAYNSTLRVELHAQDTTNDLLVTAG